MECSPCWSPAALIIQGVELQISLAVDKIGVGEAGDSVGQDALIVDIVIYREGIPCLHEKSLRLFSRLPLHGVPHIDHDKMDLLTVLFKGRLKVQGISSLQGGQVLAQKFSTTGLSPIRSDKSNKFPSGSSRGKEGAGTGLLSWEEEALSSTGRQTRGSALGKFVVQQSGSRKEQNQDGGQNKSLFRTFHRIPSLCQKGQKLPHGASGHHYTNQDEEQAGQFCNNSIVGLDPAEGAL